MLPNQHTSGLSERDQMAARHVDRWVGSPPPAVVSPQPARSPAFLHGEPERHRTRAPRTVTFHEAGLAHAIMLSPGMDDVHSILHTRDSGTCHGDRSDVEPTRVRVLRPRANKDEMASQRSCISVQGSPEPGDVLNWLPYVGSKAPFWTNKAMCENLIQKRRHRDWFVAFASALHEIKKDSTQSKMVTKMYVFLREFIPRGLTAVGSPFLARHSSPRTILGKGLGVLQSRHHGGTEQIHRTLPISMVTTSWSSFFVIHPRAQPLATG